MHNLPWSSLYVWTYFANKWFWFSCIQFWLNATILTKVDISLSMYCYCMDICIILNIVAWWFVLFFQHESLSDAHSDWEVSLLAEILHNACKRPLTSHRSPMQKNIQNNDNKNFMKYKRCLPDVVGKIRLHPISHFAEEMDVICILHGEERCTNDPSRCFPFCWLIVCCPLQECYVHNLLRVTIYIPSIRRDVLELIVGKMLKLDVGG